MVRKYWDQITGNKASMYIDTDGCTHLIIYGKGFIVLDKRYDKESIARSVLFRRPGMWSRFRMSDDERGIVSKKIFHFIRCYDAHKYTLPKVFSELVELLMADGHDVEITDESHRNYKLFNVDGRSFRLYRMKGWSQYQIN